MINQLSNTLALSLVCLIGAAHAGPPPSELNIANATKHELSFQPQPISSACAASLKSIEKVTIQRIPMSAIKNLCSSYCTFNVYSEANCKGEIIGVIGIDIKLGAIMAQPLKQDINIIINGFNVFLEGDVASPSQGIDEF